jgi:hypothetical protein
MLKMTACLGVQLSRAASTSAGFPAAFIIFSSVPEVREVVFICRISPNRSVSHDISIIFVSSIVIFGCRFSQRSANMTQPISTGTDI